MIQPIPTVYAGTTFRSRTEARWAVFFDALKIEWRYEHEGYELPSGRYLPDFWLPGLAGGTWVEVKGEAPTEDECTKCEELRDATSHEVALVIGAPLDALTTPGSVVLFHRPEHGSPEWARLFEAMRAALTASKHSFWDPRPGRTEVDR